MSLRERDDDDDDDNEGDKMMWRDERTKVEVKFQASIFFRVLDFLYQRYHFI